MIALTLIPSAFSDTIRKTIRTQITLSFNSCGRHPVQTTRADGLKVYEYFINIRTCQFMISLPVDCMTPEIQANSEIEITQVTVRSEKATQWSLKIPRSAIQCSNSTISGAQSADGFLTCNRLPKGPATTAAIMDETQDYFRKEML